MRYVMIMSVVVLVGLQCRAQTGPAGKADPERAIRARVALINRAWQAEDGSPLFADLLSDKFTASIPHPGKPGAWLVLDKQQFCQAFRNAMAHNRPKKHFHRVKRVVAFGALCHELGTSIHIGADGKKRQDEILNVWKKEGDTWRLIFSTHTAMLEKVLPPGQGK